MGGGGYPPLGLDESETRRSWVDESDPDTMADIRERVPLLDERGRKFLVGHISFTTPRLVPTVRAS